MRCRLLCTLATGFLAVACPSALQAQSSTGSISLQAKLTGVADGPHTVTLRFYDAPSGGSVVETAVVPNVIVTGGIFSADVSVSHAAFSGSDRWWTAAVDTGAELAPRALVTSVPFSLWTHKLRGGSLSEANILGPAVTNSGFFATGAIGAFPYGASHSPGEFHNWLGTETSADFIPLVGGSGESNSGYGVLVGPSIASSIAWFMRDAVNGFQVRAVESGPSETLAERLASNNANTARTVLTATFRDGEPRVGVGVSEPANMLHVAGTTRTHVLVITGGSDVAEPVAVNSSKALPAPAPGMVMVIDRDHDGKLVPCSTEYDKAVAGVLSGANGLKPGMVLSAEGQSHTGTSNDTMPLAMVGRVWVLCDATTGPIRRGDALTTSSTPRPRDGGHR